jgi:trimeric autotransporter adhesin
MASTIKIKRSSTSGNAPTTSDISAGELALNTADKIMYSSDGSTVFEIGSNLTTQTVGNLTVNTGFIFDGITFTAAQTSAEAFVDNDTSLMTSAAIADKIESYGYGTGGGAALELYAENPSSPTAPSATGTNAVAIGNGSTATNTDAFAIGRLTDATGSGSVAIGYSVDATGLRSLAIGAGTDATSSYASAIGTNSGNSGSQAVTGAGAMALGGSYASGTDSFAAAITNNTATYGATGANSVAIGQQAKATQPRSISIGPTSTASGTDAVAIGYNTTAVGSGLALGSSAKANVGFSSAMLRSSTNVAGQFSYGGSLFSTVGDAQGSARVLIAATTNDTPATLTQNASPSTTNQIILPNNSAYSFSGTIIARQQASAGSEYASWEIKGALLRDANAASTVLGSGIKNKLFASAGASAWDITLTADTTNGGLAITVTGAAATNIRWVATVNTSEVTY